MRRHIASVCFVVVSLVAATVSVAGASIVPASVERAIPNRVPAYLRYVPTELPLGYRFAEWHGARSGLEIYFARKGRPATLHFFAGAAGPSGTCTAGGTHVYRFGSVRVFFEKDRYDEQFWRCARAGRVSIEATVRRTDNPGAAKRRAIAAMVASATHLG